MAPSITKQAYTRQDMYGVGSASGSGCEPAGSSIGSSRTKRAPPPGVREAQLAAHLARPARGRWRARGRSRPRPTARCRARSARRSARDRRATTPGPVVVDGDRGVLAVVGGHDADGRGRRRVAQRVVEQDAHARGPRRSGRRGPSTARAAAGTSSVDLALGGAQLELGGHRAAQLAELDGLLAQRHVGVEPAEVEQLAGQAAPGAAARAGRRATWRRASSWSRRPSRRSSSSSSIVPCSEVSGVRSSCEAVATNERRAASWRRSSRCIVASARARSPTSSRPSSRGVGASVPSSATRTAAARRRASRRPMRGGEADAEQRARRAGRRRRRRGTRCGPGATAVVTSVSCFCVTSTKSVVGVGLRSPGSPARHGRAAATTMTWLSLADRARVGGDQRRRIVVARAARCRRSRCRRSAARRGPSRRR